MTYTKIYINSFKNQDENRKQRADFLGPFSIFIMIVPVLMKKMLLFL